MGKPGAANLAALRGETGVPVFEGHRSWLHLELYRANISRNLCDETLRLAHLETVCDFRRSSLLRFRIRNNSAVDLSQDVRNRTPSGYEGLPMPAYRSG